MLIERVVEKNNSSGEDQVVDIAVDTQYETANELYTTKAAKHLDAVVENSFLKTSDLVILYENIDHGTKFIQSNNRIKNKTPNQYVETIVYNDDAESEGSDMSDIYSHEDLRNIHMPNNERINLLNNMSSFETTLCHKYGNVDIQHSDLLNEYDKHFLFNDPYIKQQLNIHAMSQCKYSDSAVFPASLLDYICCRRLEDNYNFYMDNIIKYVQRTIEQLKRISNGDYLTEKAKEKWRGVDGLNKTDEYKNTALLSCADIPVFVEKKENGERSTWDDIVHSEMDVRCLTKILEKKIIVEVPKLLSGTYKLFSRCCKDNIIISCKKDMTLAKQENRNKSHLNVVLKLKRSDSGTVTSNINSVIILETLPSAIVKTESYSNNMIVELKGVMPDRNNKFKIIELGNESTNLKSASSITYNQLQGKYDTDYEDNDSNCYSLTTCDTSSVATPDELGYTIRRLKIKSPVLEENEDASLKKKKSPLRVRIKSPYENRSHIIEEKKRRKLLEIREKREKKKIALNENSKVTKPKYGKGAIMAQSSNSVTKLSITNKSFYNSIYGQTLKMDNKNYKKAFKKDNTDNCPVIDLDYEEEYKKETMSTPDKNSLNYISHSYYLDEADTEMQNYLQMKLNKSEDTTRGIVSGSASTVSNDIGSINILKRLITNTSTTDLSGTDTTTSSLHQNILGEANEDNTKDYFTSEHNNEVVVPTNTPKDDHDDPKLKNYKKIITFVECRKSIDKIYDLMKKIDDTETDCKSCKTKSETDKVVLSVGEKSCNLQGSESGTSFKHQLTSSNPSCISFEKNNSINQNVKKYTKKKSDRPIPIVPKVVINSKLQLEKLSYKISKEDKKNESRKLAENPLKAISQLLHDIDNVQKTRHKSGNELKSCKKYESLTPDVKNTARPFRIKRVNRQDNEPINPRFSSYKDKKYQNLTNDTVKLSTAQANEKSVNKNNKKKIADIIDEVKELKGEAVRGPSNSRRSRLDSLAQPKKIYVQAHQEEYQARHGKFFLTERHKSPTNQEKNLVAVVNRNKRASDILPTSAKQSLNGPSLEKTGKSRLTSKTNQGDDEKNYSMPIKRPYINKITAPGSLKKKMVAVETYVNNHYSEMSPTLALGDNKKSRVPLIPSDIDLDSVTSSPTEESTTLGNKLHYMINSMVTTTKKPLAALNEYKESPTKFENSDDETDSDQELSKIDEVISASEFDVDIFKDKNIVTAVACLSKEKQNNEIDEIKLKDDSMQSITKNETHNPENELQKLENAIYNQISSGTFHKQLRIKNLTLTPKPSLQQVIVLNSGDDKSVIVKSTMSQKFNFPVSDTISEIKIVPILSNKSINRTFPMQIATVGYVFPKHKAMIDLTETFNIRDKTCISSINKTSCNNEINDKIMQCNMRIHKDSVRNENNNLSLTKVNTCDDKVCELTDGIEQNIQNALYFEKAIPSVEKCMENETMSKTENTENISNTTSLDILVRLLNEIKKITSCQADLVQYEGEKTFSSSSKDLEVILNKTSIQESTPDVSIKNSVSVSSFIDLKQGGHFQSGPLCLTASKRNNSSGFEKNYTNNMDPLYNFRPNNIDKEITVAISQKEFLHTFTDVPSRFLVTTVNNKVGFTDSFTITRKTSSQSMKSFADCQTFLTTSSYHKITEFNSILISKDKRNERQHNAISKTLKSNRNVVSEFDPIMKMKRDILVTVYSILVLTVFAALTFPEIVPRA